MSRRCDYPAVQAAGMCCGAYPCDLEWYHPCEREGGCWDFQTCGNCAEPVYPGRSAREWAAPEFPPMEAFP